MKQELSKNKYLYKRLKLEEIKNPQYFFEVWSESNLVKFLIRIFFNKENFIKLFDFRIISSLILQDLHSSKSNKSSTINTFLLLTFSVFLYHLNNKAIIEKKHLNLVKIVYGHINYSKYKEKNLKESFNKKSLSTFTNSSFSKITNLKKKKKYSIIKTNFKKKIYAISTYNQNLVGDSEWWKVCIVEQILPSWKISASSIKKIKILLKDKTTDDLKHFFEFYIDNILCQNYDWETNFNSIFYKTIENNTNLSLNIDKKILNSNLIFQIFYAFCEKLLFEIETPLNLNQLNSTIKLNNNNKLFFSSSKSYQKTNSPELLFLLKKSVSQNFKFWGEDDSLIVKSYIFIKKKGWFFFNNYAEFYIWQLYKNSLVQYENDLDKFTLNENKSNLKLFKLKSLENKKKNLKINNDLSEISYQITKYILYKVKNFNKEINNHKIIDQNLKFGNKKKTRIKQTLNLTETKFFLSNKNFFKWILYKKKLNSQSIKQNTNSTIWDLDYFLKNENNKIKSNLFLSPFFKKYLLSWIQNLFREEEKYLINTASFENKKDLIFNNNYFLNNLFVDELNMSLTKKYKKNFEPINQQKKEFFRDIKKSDTNRLIRLWKINKIYKNVNSFIFSDYVYKIISKKKYDINKFNLSTNLKLPTNIFYLLDSFVDKFFNIKKSNKFIFFQIKYFLNLISFLDQINLLIIKHNLLYNKKFNGYINYEITNKFKLKNKLLVNKLIYKKTKIDIKNNLKKAFQNSNFVTNNFSIKSINFYQYIYNNYYKNLKQSLNSLFLINKNIFSSKKTNFKNITINIIDPKVIIWKEKGKNYFSYNILKKNIFNYWKYNKYTLINQKNKNRFKFFLEKQKNLIVLSNQISFLNNKTSIIKWSKKLDKKNTYIFYKNFILIFSENFNNISKVLLYYSNIFNIQNNFLKNKINENNLVEQVKFNIYYKLKTQYYFDKILTTKFLINYFNSNYFYIKSFNNNILYSLLQNQENYFNSIKISDKNSLNSQFFKADTSKLVNFLYYSDLNYKKKLNFYLKKKKNNLLYLHLIKNVSIKKNTNLSTNQLTFFYKIVNKNSNNKLKIYKTFLFKKINEFNTENLLVISNFNLNKLANSFISFNPIFSTKKSLEKNRFFQTSLQKNSDFYTTNSFKMDLLSEFLIKIQKENNRITNKINKLFITNSNYEKILINNILNKNRINKKINSKTNQKTNLSFSKNSIKLIPQMEKFKIFTKSSFSLKWNSLFQKYIPWFFTFKWWKYFQNLSLNLFSEILLNITDQFYYILPTVVQTRKKNLNYLLENIFCNLKNKVFGNSLEIWNLRLLEESSKQHKSNENELIWFSLNLVNKWNRQYIVTISLIIFTYFILQKYFSILLGSDYLELWGDFKIIQYLIDSSRGIYLDNLLNNNSIKFIKSENLLIHFVKNSKHYIKNIIFYLFTKKKINKLLIKNKGIDLSRRERKLLVQSLISDKSIDRYRTNFSYSNSTNFQFGNKIIKQQKFKNYLENLTENYQKNLINYPFHQFYLAENLVFLSSWQKATSLNTLWQINNLNSTFYKKPIPLELRLFSSKGILLIGSIESGRSYLVKNVAANSFIPLIKISINKLLYNKPDILTESWINILMESLRRLNLILELAQKLSPCIIWMPNIHELNVNRSTQNVESDPTFLLGIFLKYFQTGFSKKNTNNIIIIGSTHLPKKVDPALISPNRLDRLINIRIFNVLQRQKKISNLLYSKSSKYFYSKQKKSSLNEFGSRTIGYNARDLTGLINEILLISINQHQSTIQKKTIRLAFHRQTLGSTYINNKINFTKNYGILFYKIGKVIVQNLFIKNSSKNPLYFGNDLWKKKFYYLSKWYLEPSIFESTIKEFTILPHILGCLAGLAARDSWFILKNKPDNLISLDQYAENDFYLACGILESLLRDFSWLEIFEEKNINKKNFLNFQFQAKNPLHMVKKGLYNLTSNIVWAPKISRLNFIRTNLFNWINRPNEFESISNLKKTDKKSITGSSENSNSFELVQHKIKEQLPYERILSRIRRRNVQELESQLEDLLLEEQFVILGFSRLFTEYRMESQLSTKPLIFSGGRFLWDPTGLLYQNHNFVFSRQDLFIDGEMLRRLYVTYGARREREKSRSSQKIKQFFLRRGYGRDSINDFSINWWNQLPFIEKNNIETFKRIEGIGVQLKRPQLFTPVYLYQRWLIENPQKNLTRFELLNSQQRWLKTNKLLLNDSLIYSTLLEIYQYLLQFFISHQVLLNEMTEVLLKNKWIFQNEIEDFIVIMNKK